jgi:hypothetical protein
MPRKVCILGVHHAYQFQVVRPTYIQTVTELVQIHSVDLIAEESADHITTYVQAAVAAGRIPGVKWTNVDLSRDERKLLKRLKSTRNRYASGLRLPSSERTGLGRTNHQGDEELRAPNLWVLPSIQRCD